MVDFVNIERDVKFDVLERFINPAHAEKLADWVKDNQQQVKAILENLLILIPKQMRNPD